MCVRQTSHTVNGLFFFEKVEVGGKKGIQKRLAFIAQDLFMAMMTNSNIL